MKKSIVVLFHLIFWTLFSAVTVIQSELFLEAKPDAPFASHFFYVNFLEVFMGLIFFYVTYFSLPWAVKKTGNGITLAAILLFLLLFFAFPAMKIGLLQVMSSVIPHLFLIFLGIIFRLLSGGFRLEQN